MNLLTLLVVLATVCGIKGCELDDEIYKAGVKFADKVLKEQDKSIDIEGFKGCWFALVTGDSSKCDPTKFKMQQFPSCEKFSSHPESRERIKEYNIKKFKSMIENVLFSADCDPDELCEQMPQLCDQGITILEEYIKGGPEAAEAASKKFCEKDKEQCEMLKSLPQKIAEKFGKDFNGFIKQMKQIGKSKGMAVSSQLTDGIKTMFGGGEVGELAAKCFTEIASAIGKKVVM